MAERYAIGATAEGLRIPLPDDTNVYFEQYIDCNSITWPILLMPLAFHEKTREILELPASIYLIYSKDKEKPQLRANLTDYQDDILDVVKRNPGNGPAVIWQRSLHDDNSLEGGLVYKQEIPEDKLHALWRATGTLAVTEGIELIQAEITEQIERANA